MSSTHPFQNSRNLVFQNCQFKDEVRQYTYRSCETSRDYRAGLQSILVPVALLDAIHDSAAREKLLDFIPKTHHTGFISTFASWVHQYRSSPTQPVALLTGPKSDLAQRCADHLETHLAATYFISDPQWDDPTSFLPTIAYQLATHLPAYAEALESIVRCNPAVLTKSLRVQFRELILRPLSEAKSRNVDMDKRNLIIIEGLDQYKRHVQREILRVVVAAADEGLPLRWAFFSQRDPHLDCDLGLGKENICWEVNLYSLTSGTLPVGRQIVRLERDLSETARSRSFVARICPSTHRVLVHLWFSLLFKLGLTR